MVHPRQPLLFLRHRPRKSPPRVEVFLGETVNLDYGPFLKHGIPTHFFVEHWGFISKSAKGRRRIMGVSSRQGFRPFEFSSAS
jgi:hypothetical protein